MADAKAAGLTPADKLLEEELHQSMNLVIYMSVNREE